MAAINNNDFSHWLKIWRKRKRLSQLDLALAADISPKHLSFLENGRSKPSKEMVTRLSKSLQLSEQESENLMVYAGYEDQAKAEVNALERHKFALQAILKKHEPYPGIIVNRDMRPVLITDATIKLLDWLELDMKLLEKDMMEWLVAPNGLRKVLVNWEEAIELILMMLSVKLKSKSAPVNFTEQFSRLLQFEGMRAIWQKVEKRQAGGAALPPTVNCVLQSKGVTISWVLVLTSFGAAPSQSLDDFQCQFFFPTDKETEQFALAHLS